MKTLNLIGSLVLAVSTVGWLAACDSRGVTAMQARTFTPEERAQARTLRHGNATAGEQRTDLAPSEVTAGPTPAAPPAKPAAPNQTDEDEHGAPSLGEAKEKNFFEKEGPIEKASLKQDVLAGIQTPSARAAELLKGVSIVNNAGSKTISLSAVIKKSVNSKDVVMLDASDLELPSNEAADVKRYKSLFLINKDAVRTAIPAEKFALAAICVRDGADKACDQVILIFSWPVKAQQAKADLALVLIERNGARWEINTSVTNAGTTLLSYTKALEAANQIAPKAPTANAAPANAPAAPAAPAKPAEQATPADDKKTGDAKPAATPDPKLTDAKANEAKAGEAQAANLTDQTAQPAGPTIKSDAPKEQGGLLNGIKNGLKGMWSYFSGAKTETTPVLGD